MPPMPPAVMSRFAGPRYRAVAVGDGQYVAVCVVCIAYSILRRYIARYSAHRKTALEMKFKSNAVKLFSFCQEAV